MRLPPLNALRVFLSAAEHLSFTRAAAALHLTQGAVSRQVQSLEAFYGVPLFRRLSRGLALTPEGEALLLPVRHAFARLAEASEALLLRQSDLRIRCPPTSAMRWILPNLPEFQILYPEYTVHLITSTHEALDFQRGGYDVALQGLDGLEGLPDDLTAELISREQLVPVCAPSLLEKKPLRTPDDLRHHTLLHPWRSNDDYWLRWLQLAGARRVDHRQGLKFDTLEFALNAAGNGMGVTLAQLSMIHDDVARGRLVMPFDTVLETEWSYYLVYPSATAGQPKLKAFRDWLLTLLEQEGVRSRD